jgi:hypothetical protein
MSSLLTSLAILFASGLLVAGLLIWIMLRPCVLHLFVNYRSDSLRMGIELGSGQRSLLSASMHNEGERWHARVQSRTHPVWQQSWAPFINRPWHRILRRLWRLWKHPKRPAWQNVSWRLIREIWQQVKLQQAVTTVRAGFEAYPQTGYLAAVAYPLNFTLFRALSLWRLMVIPDFTAKGWSVENHLLFSFRGYQLLKPGYHFLRSPEVSRVLKRQLSKRLRRLGLHFRR